MIKSITALALLTYGVLVLEANAQRSYLASNFALDLDGTAGGLLRSVEGGAVTAEVIETPQAGYAAEKHLGNLKYESFEVEYGLSNPSALLDWISATWNREHMRKNGAIIAADYKLDAKSKREFFNAAITETTIPACDGSSKDPGHIKVKFAPEYTRQVKASGKLPGPLVKDQRKAWLPANFRLTIDGLDCTKIARIESLTVKNIWEEEKVGDMRDYIKEPAKIEFPNLKVTLNSMSAETWQLWFESFVIQGNNTSQDEKKGRLEFLSPNRQEVLATIEFSGLGIFRLQPDKAEAAGDAVQRTTAELYCENMKFIPGGTKP